MLVKNNISTKEHSLLREPVDVKVELEGSSIGRVVTVKVFLEKVHNGVSVVVVAGRGEDALIGMVAGVELIPQRVDGNFPEAREGLCGTLEWTTKVGRLSLLTV